MHSNRDDVKANWKRRVTAGLIACAVGWPVNANAAMPAGTRINNVAAAIFTVGSDNFNLSSNQVTSCVAEVLDVSLTALPATDATAIPFQLVNGGNGSEAFTVAATISGQSSGLRIMIDADHDGRYDATKDTNAVDNGTTPLVAAGGTMTLFVLTGGNNGEVTFTAQAVTGSGPAGTTFAGRGDGGCDAVSGPHAGYATARSNAAPSASDAQLIKSQTVSAPDGSTTPVPGATITYRLDATLRGGAPLRGASISDAIPAGTEYIAGSLTLDGQPVADTGHYDGSTVQVALGDIEQPSTRTVTFKVKIK